MPFVNPVPGLGANSVPVVSAALASLAVGIPDEVKTALATAIVYGEPRLSAYASARVRTEIKAGNVAALDAGAPQRASAGASLDAGRAEGGASLGEIETSGEGQYNAPGTFEVGDSGSLGLSQKRYGVTLTSVDVGGNPLASASASLTLRSEIKRAAYASLTQRQDKAVAVLASLATVISGVQGGSLGALDAGELQEREALGSIEVERAEGVDIVIDITDETVAGARGDVC